MSTTASLHDEPLQLLTRGWIKQAFVTRSPVMYTVATLNQLQKRGGGRKEERDLSSLFLNFFPFYAFFC